MKMWHWLIVVVIVYLIGVKFPGPGQAVFSKIGM